MKAIGRAWGSMVAAAAAVGAMVAAPPASAAEGGGYTIDEFQVSSKDDAVCNVHAADRGSILWFIEAAGRRIGRLDTATGKVERFDLPKVAAPVAYTTTSADAMPGGDAAQGPCDLATTPDGMLWFNDQAANSVGVMETRAPYRITMVPLPTPKSLPMALQLGADGAIYVLLTAVDKIARINPATHHVTEIDLPVKHAGIIGGAPSAKDGAHWFILMNTGELLRMDYATGKMQRFKIPTPNAAPFVIRSYDDGLWFTMFGAGAIGHFDPATGTFDEIRLASVKTAPIGIFKGSDGFLYTDLAGVDAIARIDRKTRTVVAEYPLPSKNSFADEIKLGPDGAIWLPEYMTGKLARLWLPSFGKDPGVPQPAK